MPSAPILKIPVQENLVPFLGDLFDTDCILDKVETSFSSDGRKIVSGSYRFVISLVCLFIC